MKTKIKVSPVTWVLLGVALFLFLVLSWWYRTYDKVAFERNMGYSQEARQNEFLAAQMFLGKLDVKLSVENDFGLFDDSLGQFDTVLINSSRIGMSTSRREKMKAWVEGGGHIVLLATEFYEYDFRSSRDAFLDELGLRFYDSSDDYTDYSEEESVTLLEFEDYDKSTEVHFYSDGYIEDTSGEAVFIAGPDHADQIVQYDLGEGLVTIVVDFSVWFNERIDNHDHAIFLTQLIGNSDKAWLVYNRIQPSLWQMMWDKSPLIVFSSGLILLLFILGQLWRKGSPVKDSEAVQREIMQHISAAGEFAYRNDNGENLLQELHHGIEQRMTQLVHGYSRMSPSRQLEKLAAITSLPKAELEPLWDFNVENQDAFLAKVQLVQAIRKHL